MEQDGRSLMNQSPPEHSPPPSPRSPRSFLSPLSPLSSSSLPALTRLYHLEPMGMGGPLAESLVSYIARLAAAHCVAPMRLIVDEIAPCAGKRYAHNRRVTQQFFADWRHTLALCGSGPVARDWTRALEHLTGRSDLAQLTLAPLNQIVTVPTAASFRRERTWCPVCYDQWRTEGTALYAPLLWMMRSVMRCPIHHIPLAMRCPNTGCGQTARWLVGQYHQGRCPACDSWLGQRPYMAEPLAPPLSQMEATREQGIRAEAPWPMRASEIVGTLYVLSAGRQPPMSTPGTLAQSLAHWRSAMTVRLLKHVQRHTGITARRLNEWSDGKSRPSLMQLLSLCRILDMSGVDLLSSNESNIRRHLELVAQRLEPSHPSHHARVD